MEASQIQAKIDKIKAMSGISDKAKADMIAAWEKKLPKDKKPQPQRVKKSADDVKPKKIKVKFKVGDEVIFFGHQGESKPSVFVVKELLGKDEEIGDMIYRIQNKNDLEDKVDRLQRTLLKYKPGKHNKPAKTKTTYKFKGKAVSDLDADECAELQKQTAERRKKAAAAEKKSKSRPIIEKVTVPIVKAVKKAIENIPAADLKDDPKKELTMVDKAIAATKRFMIELKGIFGEDWDKEAVDGEMKDLHTLGKELHKKYGE